MLRCWLNRPWRSARCFAPGTPHRSPAGSTPGVVEIVKRYCFVVVAAALFALSPAQSVAQTKEDMERLADRLRRVVSSIPEVKTSEEYGKPVVLTVAPTISPMILQGAGRVGAIKFKSPTAPTPRKHFVWAFSPPENLHGWQIVRVKKSAKIGFKNFFNDPDKRYANLPAPLNRQRFILQALDASNFEPNEEYIILFLFADKNVTSLTVALSFVALSESVPIYGDAEALEAALGLVPAK